MNQKMWQLLTTAKTQSTAPELVFSAGSYFACSVSDVCDGYNLGQQSQLNVSPKTLL